MAPNRITVLACLTLVGFVVLSCPPALAQGAPPLRSLDDLFADEIDDLLSRPLALFEPRGPGAIVFPRFTKIEMTGYGNSFEAYPSSVDPFTDPSAPTVQVESRSTLEIYIPASIDFGDTDSAWLMIWKTPKHVAGEPEPEETAERRLFARKAAERGIASCLFFDHDRHPVIPGQPTESVAAQLGYGEGRLSNLGMDWMQRRDPAVAPLDPDDFKRMWRHYGLGKSYMLAGTFAQDLILDVYGAPAAEWVASLRFLVGGGSKGVGGVICAAGADPRVKAVRFSGSQELNTDDRGAHHRYETDWSECPGGQHPRADFAHWAWTNRNLSPSYFDIFLAGNDPDRYRDKLWIDVVGTHDVSVPLASHSTFWDARDGLVGGVVDPQEEMWNVHIVRRPNANHGVSTLAGFHRSFEVEATDLLLWRTLRHLVSGGELPRVDIVSADVSDDTTWSVRARVTDVSTQGGEDYAVWVLLSDDRDTRRCTSPIMSREFTDCFDSPLDDNKPEEDYFIRIPAQSAIPVGDLLEITFPVPAERAAFSATTPMVALFVELFDRGQVASSVVDDTLVHSEVLLVNAELYPDGSCPP